MNKEKSSRGHKYGNKNEIEIENLLKLLIQVCGKA